MKNGFFVMLRHQYHYKLVTNKKIETWFCSPDLAQSNDVKNYEKYSLHDQLFMFKNSYF